jgi:hypothetical protein
MAGKPGCAKTRIIRGLRAFDAGNPHGDAEIPHRRA